MTVGQSVTLRTAPGYLKAYVGMPGTVQAVDMAVGVCDVAFETGEEPKPVLPIPFGYLQHATAGKQSRRSPLNLNAPKDTRTEAQRMADGLAALEQLGYSTLRVGQGRAAAICHKCSREQKRMVLIRCKCCDSEGFAPSTNSTKGTPDSFVFSDRWPRWAFCALEWKDGPHGQRQPEQIELERRSRIVVVWDTPGALTAVAEFERSIGMESLPALLAAVVTGAAGEETKI